MRIDVVTVFPEYLLPLDLALVGKARTTGLLDLAVHDLRTWATDARRTVDDTPLGGGAGMVMRPDVWGQALDAVLGLAPDDDAELIFPSPSGEPLTQRTAERLAGRARLLIACGRYEGIDARVADHYRSQGLPVTELSIGDYVLAGGEVAALVVIEAVTRLLPGVLGNPESLQEESHDAGGLLEYPVFTRPPVWRDLPAPQVLLSGHHAKVRRWRRDQALAVTSQRRPDLLRRLDPRTLDKADRAQLSVLGWVVTEGSVVPHDEAPAGR